MNNIRINYFVIVIIALFSAAIIALNINWPDGQKVQINKILSRGELRVSTIPSPLITIDNKKDPVGFDYELVKRFADYLGVKLVVNMRTNINQLFDDLENNKADFIAAGLLYDKERLSATRSGPAYFSVSQQLIYRKGTLRPRSFDAIDGNLVVTAGSAHASLLRTLKETQYPELEWEESQTQTTSQLLEALSEGKITYVLADSISVAVQQCIHPNVAVGFEVTESRPLTWYLPNNEDNSLYAAMLDYFNQISQEDVLARLEEKYFGHVGSFDYFDTISFITAIDSILPNYQPLFEKYADTFDWPLLAAMAWQESHWDPHATSPTGVRGLMMLTQPTASSMGVEDRLDPEESIRGGTQYLKYLLSRLPSSIPEDERIWFALAAYNIGYGHMLDARRLTEQQNANPDSWLDVKSRLPLLSKKEYYSELPYGYARGHEAYRYVENIRRYQLSLVGYLQAKESKNKILSKDKDEISLSSQSKNTLSKAVPVEH
ncbi:membrane-bound lytic murein transglycosylase MltF [Proteus myxofaciens]|uniref:Membrane-bound lytic murein transglycosylase F n=1 Tax=Proteus myxofaciens ATCC 19692 TaxID=1354337 RepID=A0A198GEG0_9GAMM|nr:membrane-bound lytic murein transglycosylase MltF [Proteus myxofaciens]OAT35184.1 Slt family transglycosylase [Proteus myxofaciens ATCC 19692]